MARLRSCKYCGRIHAVDYNCGQTPGKRRSEASRLRTNRRWDKSRKSVRERDNFLCRACLAQGVLQSEGLEVHHIVPLHENEELAYEVENLITLCRHHHKQADRGYISRELLRRLASG